MCRAVKVVDTSVLNIFVDANVLTFPFGNSNLEMKRTNHVISLFPNVLVRFYFSDIFLLGFFLKQSICLRLPVIFKGTQEVM